MRREYSKWRESTCTVGNAKCVPSVNNAALKRRLNLNVSWDTNEHQGNRNNNQKERQTEIALKLFKASYQTKKKAYTVYQGPNVIFVECWSGCYRWDQWECTGEVLVEAKHRKNHVRVKLRGVCACEWANVGFIKDKWRHKVDTQ